MSALLLNLLNELENMIKCEACRAFYLFFSTSIIHSMMLDSIYHITLRLLRNFISGVKTS